MTKQTSDNSENHTASDKYLPALVVLFIGSGCAALMYEVIWLQMLGLVVGSSAISLGVLLGTFMGGMCLGSLLLPRFVPRDKNPLLVYVVLELGIGILGLILLFAIPLVGHVYSAMVGDGIFGFLLRGVVAALLLLPPTILMGATLPAISRLVETTPKGVSWLGFFYGGNIAGAVAGCLLAGFYFLRVHDVYIATFAAVALNAAVVAFGYLLSTKAHVTKTEEVTTEKPVKRAPHVSAVYWGIALSGFTALGAEVIWTRLLSLLFGATTYTFSIILAVFLLGLGIGSSASSFFARTVRNPRLALGVCQFLLVVMLAWAAFNLGSSLPNWPIDPYISPSPWFNFQIDIVRAMWAILPSAILWGASFPLALAAAAAPGQDPGKLVGGVYASNTVGAIFGSLLFAIILIPTIGTKNSQQLLILVSAFSASLVLLSIAPKLNFSWLQQKFLRKSIVTGALLITTIWLVASVPPISDSLIAYGRYSASWVGDNRIIFYGEGMNSSMAVSELPNGVRNYHNAGKIQASSEPQDMRLQRMLGHLTTLVPKTPRSILVIGCGAGITAGAVSISPLVEKVTIVEIEMLVPEVVSTYFSYENYDVVRNPKVIIRNDDARHFLISTKEKFDAITSDPFDPWVKGAATLYSKEFFEVMKDHLNPGGVVTLFVQLYESNMAAVKSEVATFFEVFPHGVVWGNTLNGQGYDIVVMGQVEPLRINIDEMEARLNSFEFSDVSQSLSEIGFYSAVDLFSTYAGTASDFEEWLRDAQINRDRNLRLQYLAGMGVNLYQADIIYADMLKYSKFPDEVFSGSDDLMASLREKIRIAQGK